MEDRGNIPSIKELHRIKSATFLAISRDLHFYVFSPFSCADWIKDDSVYKVLKKGFFEELNIENWLKNEVLGVC